MTQFARCFDDPVTNETLVRLVSGGRGVLASDDASPQQGIIETTGHHTNVDVWFSLDGDWALENPLFRLFGTNGPIRAALDERRLLDAQFLDVVTTPAGVPTRVTGLLFSVRGKATDRFNVVGFKGVETLSLGRFYARAWFGDGFYADRNMRPPIDLFARPNQQVLFTTPTGLAPPVVPAIAANPTGGRIGITGIQWTGDQPSISVSVADVTAAGVPLTVWIARAGLAGANVNDHFTQPIYTRRGSTVQIFGGAVAANNQFNVQAFYE